MGWLAELARAASKPPSVVIITGSADKPDKVRIGDLGVAHVLDKPKSKTFSRQCGRPFDVPAVQ